MYRLFLDDERFPINVECVIARTSDAAFEIVSRLGIPVEISFDHDLGGDDTAIQFINKLIDFMIDENMKFPIGFQYYIHSQNPIGAANIKAKMDSFINHIGYCE
jgi:hypothetical protein